MLLKPRLSAHTYLLWGAPIALFVIGAVAMAVYARSRVARPTGRKLSDEEQAALDRLLKE